MKSIFLSTIAILLISLSASAQEKVFTLGKFKKVIINPHIEATFVQGDEEKVEIISISEPTSAMNADVKNGTLTLYLDGAKIDAKVKNWKDSDYDGTVASVRITYKNLDAVDIRGAEKIHFSSKLDQSDFRMTMYGESHVIIDQVDLSDFRVKLYGESMLKVKEGTIDYQKYTAYGESVVYAQNVDSRVTKITAYGESEYSVQVEEDLKVTAFGESEIKYSGNADVSKKLLGEASVERMN